MLEMYLLALVITGSVWERFQDPTDSKNHQKLHRISHNPLPAAPRYSGFVQTLLSRCTENDLLQKLLGVRQIPASSVRTRTYVNFPLELIAGHKPSRGISGHQHSHKF